MIHPTKRELSQSQKEELLKTLKIRFERNTHRHPELEWTKIEFRLKEYPEKLWSLNEMEKTGGEPDVVAFDIATGEYIFYDCADESPKDRRSLCYDQEALDKRKTNKPKDSAVGMAYKMGITLLTEQQYRELQNLEDLDAKTSSWLATPDDIRQLKGAIFGDRRFGRVFVYHNGAESYYAGRGFRGELRV